MATDFNIGGHELLSEKAARLGIREALPAQAALAADLLGLAALDLGAAQKKSAERALAIQVSFQVEAGADAAIYDSRRRADRTDDFAGSSRRPFTGIDPRAERIANSLRAGVEAAEEQGADEWSVIKTLR